MNFYMFQILLTWLNSNFTHENMPLKKLFISFGHNLKLRLKRSICLSAHSAAKKWDKTQKVGFSEKSWDKNLEGGIKTGRNFQKWDLSLMVGFFF